MSKTNTQIIETLQANQEGLSLKDIAMILDRWYESIIDNIHQLESLNLITKREVVKGASSCYMYYTK